MGSKGENEWVTVQTLKAIVAELLDQKLAVINELIMKVSKLEKANKELEEREAERDRYSRKNNLIFHGIPLKEDEDALQVVEEIGEALGVPILPDNIDAAHRLPTRNEKLPPPFIIKFVNRWRKEKVLASAKKRKPTAACMGGDGKIKIFCNEHLPPRKQELFMEARRMKDQYFVWCQGGDILCRKKEDGARIQQIRRFEDIDALVGPRLNRSPDTVIKEGEERLGRLKNQLSAIINEKQSVASGTLISQAPVLQD